MNGMKGLKVGAVLSFVVSMLVLLGGGFFAKKQVAPYPERVTVDGAVLMTGRDILDGQDVYQKYGLMDHGSVWGHGTYRGMDFSAATLHWMGESVRDYISREKGGAYDSLSPEDRSAVDARVVALIKTNAYDPAGMTLALSPAHAYAYEKIRASWSSSASSSTSSTAIAISTASRNRSRRAVACSTCPSRRARSRPPSSFWSLSCSSSCRR